MTTLTFDLDFFKPAFAAHLPAVARRWGVDAERGLRYESLHEMSEIQKSESLLI